MQGHVPYSRQQLLVIVYVVVITVAYRISHFCASIAVHVVILLALVSPNVKITCVRDAGAGFLVGKIPKSQINELRKKGIEYPTDPKSIHRDDSDMVFLLRQRYCISIHLEVQVGVSTGQNGSTHGHAVGQDKLEGVNDERSVPKKSVMDLRVGCGCTELDSLSI